MLIFTGMCWNELHHVLSSKNMITYGGDGVMPFFFAERKVFYARDYPAGVGMPLICQEAHKALDFSGNGNRFSETVAEV